MCEFIGWCSLQPSEQAAWAQAVLSVVAIGIAILIPALQKHADRKEKRQVAERGAIRAAIATVPLLEAWVEQIPHIEEAVTKRSQSSFLWDYMEWLEATKYWLLQDASKLSERSAEAEGQLSKSLLRAAAAAEQYRYHVSMKVPTTHKAKAEFDARMRGYLADTLDASKEALRLAKDLVALWG